jgi:hypothetical protein
MGNIQLILKYQCCNELLEEELNDSIPIIEQIPITTDPLQSVGSFVTVIGHRNNNN